MISGSNLNSLDVISSLTWTDPNGLKISFKTANFIYISDSGLIAKFDSPNSVQNLFTALNIDGLIAAGTTLLDSSDNIYNALEHTKIALQDSSFEYVIAGSTPVEIYVNTTTSTTTATQTTASGSCSSSVTTSDLIYMDTSATTSQSASTAGVSQSQTQLSV